MSKHILFLQGGGGQDDYEADAKLVASLKKHLEEDTYLVHYPLLPNEESAPDFGRIKQIEKEMSTIKGEIIVVGHSLGASMLLKYLSENRIKKKIDGIFLIATPFWSGDEDWKQGFKLREDFGDHLPEAAPVFLYHSKDDDVVPFNHVKIYTEKLPMATVREMVSGGHHMNNDMSVVAKDIQELSTRGK